MQTHTSRDDASPLYRPAACFLLRAPALSATVFKHLTSPASEAVEHGAPDDLSAHLLRDEEQTEQLLQAYAQTPQIERALAVASLSLLEGLYSVRQGKANPKRTKKVLSGLLRYLVRMSTRPTPFGLFSGVALGFFAESTAAVLEVPALERLRTRPDMHWLLTALKNIEERSALRELLPVWANQLAYIAGRRVLLPNTDTYGQRHSQAVSLRATSVVRKALELASEPLPYARLAESLLQAFPGATPDKVNRLLQQLWEHGLLLSTLHPPLTDAQPVRYLTEQLPAHPEASEIKTSLAALARETATFDAAGVDGPLDPLTRIAHLQAALTPAEKTLPLLQVDSTLALSAPTLHCEIGEAAARIADILLRLTPAPRGPTALETYRRVFLEKYGPGAEVPLLDLLSPEHGLDAPPGYTQPPRLSILARSTAPSPEAKRYEHLLQTLVLEAVNRGRLEIQLDEAVLARLQQWAPVAQQAPSSLEIYLQIHAADRQALDRGEWCAVLSPNPGSPNAGRTFGRFFDVLGEPGIQALREILRKEEALAPGTIFAELSYQHRLGRVSNVAIRPGLRTYEIAVGTTPSVPPEYVIALSDLVVGISQNRFYLRSKRLGKRVVVCQLHMLSSLQAPNVCRFIEQIAFDGRPALSGFHWGSLAGLPFLPRITVRHGAKASLVLAPATWNLCADTIVPKGNDQTKTGWFQEVQCWREQWKVPRYLYLVQADNRLLLDLEHPLLLAELRAALHTLEGENTLMLQEVLPDFEHLWLTDRQGAAYFSEIVVPLLRRDPSAPSASVPAVEASSVPLRTVPEQIRVAHPGSRWSYAKLYAPPAQQEEIIAGPMRQLIAHLREEHRMDRWFFLHYTDPQPHLRLRVHASLEEQCWPLLQALLAWSRRLVERDLIQHFTLDSYEREVARYGGPEAIDVLEEVFSVDSDLCSTLIAAHYIHQITLDPLLVGVWSLDHFFTVWGYGVAHRLRWLEDMTERYAWSHAFRPHRRELCELLAPWQEHTDIDLLAQRQLLQTLSVPTTNQLPLLAAEVRDLKRADKLWEPEEDLLRSLAHMHCIRLFGLDREREQQAYAFWRQTLEAIERRPT